MRILLTGGMGYIGSHIAVELINEGHSVHILDNLCNSQIDAQIKIESITGVRPVFFYGDVTNLNDYPTNTYDALIHCAGYKAVGESSLKPDLYYENNVIGTLTALMYCKQQNINRFIFSSSATVYGTQDINPISENASLNPENPYARTKLMGEQIIQDFCHANPDFNATVLRYFNPIGAHKSGKIFENPNGIPNNLMPLLCQIANKQRDELTIFGSDYDTIDGTCVRDYIHIEDIALGHIAALYSYRGFNVYNLGTGFGTSVKQLIDTFQQINNVIIPTKLGDRRYGDSPILCSDPSLALMELDWKAKYNIEDMCRDAWNAIKLNRK